MALRHSPSKSELLVDFIETTVNGSEPVSQFGAPPHHAYPNRARDGALFDRPRAGANEALGDPVVAGGNLAKSHSQDRMAAITDRVDTGGTQLHRGVDLSVAVVPKQEGGFLWG